jgi:integrase/recombinase XerD
MADLSLLPAHIRDLPRAAEWLNLQVALGRTSNTVAAYGRGLDDYLSFCSRTGIDPERAGRAEISTYVRDMAERPPARGRSAIGLANATLCQRLTIIRLFYEHLVEEGSPGKSCRPRRRGRRRQTSHDPGSAPAALDSK